MGRPEWLPFEKARAFVRGLGLLDAAEWHAYGRGELELILGTRPDNIPASPVTVYRREGWAGWRDWLGPPPIEPVEAGYRTFKRARILARSVRLADAAAWRSWCAGTGPPGLRRRPPDIPDDPARMYPRAWRGWGDWLGTKRAPPKSNGRSYLPFERARAWARTLGLRCAREWQDVSCGRHPIHEGLIPGVPAVPSLIYRHSGWNGFGDWLGTGFHGASEAPVLAFDEAREFVRRLGLTSTAEYSRWSAGHRPDLPRRPDTIPSTPHRVYARRGWTDWGDYLGTGNIHPTKRRFRSLEAARRYARGLGFRSSTEWNLFATGRRTDLGPFPDDVPRCPHLTYAGQGWMNWGDFLGTGTVANAQRVHRPFAEARAFARSLRLRSSQEWVALVRGRMPERAPVPPDIPRTPEVVYLHLGWLGWRDFLGNDGAGAAARR
ncbi:MAG: hypothetical protein K8T90_09010 [Planctomycetes bacterium]|nr:hypothetical protein [Planctomycetota bacterium]